jgi:hypothetical protein
MQDVKEVMLPASLLAFEETRQGHGTEPERAQDAQSTRSLSTAQKDPSTLKMTGKDVVSSREIPEPHKSPPLLRKGALLKLVDHHLLCEKCESVAKEAAEEIAHQTIGLIERAKILKRPVLPAPPPPGTGAGADVTGQMKSPTSGNAPAAVSRKLLPPINTETLTPCFELTAPSPLYGADADFRFPFSAQLNAIPVEMKDITGINF